MGKRNGYPWKKFSVPLCHVTSLVFQDFYAVKIDRENIQVSLIYIITLVDAFFTFVAAGTFPPFDSLNPFPGNAQETCVKKAVLEIAAELGVIHVMVNRPPVRGKYDRACT